jgi:hypothetical protein
MPLRDHFNDMYLQPFRWEGFHSTWAVTIMRQLNRGTLPPGYHAEPRARLGSLVEVDVGTREGHSTALREGPADANGGVAVYSPPAPILTIEADLSQEDLFEVQVYDDRVGELVAAIELISPCNKDRPESRHDFVVKCANLLKARVSLVLIDIVTDRRANLLGELLEHIESSHSQTPFQEPLYCCSLLPRGANGRAKVDVWPEALQVGAVLPRLPLWLRDDLPVPLDLESTYEETCRDLRA